MWNHREEANTRPVGQIEMDPPGKSLAERLHQGPPRLGDYYERQRLDPEFARHVDEQHKEAAGQIQKALAELQRKLEMHYRNGREAKNGDKIVKLGNAGHIIAVGVLHSATPGNDYCNGNIAPIQSPVEGACMCDCLHVEDVAAFLKEKNLEDRPAGK